MLTGELVPEQIKDLKKVGMLKEDGTFSFNLNDIKFPDEVVSKYIAKTFCTNRIALFIHSLILMSQSKSYLEIGSGFGFIMVIAGMALRYNANYYGRTGYTLTGIEPKIGRANYSVKLLKESKIKGEIIHGDAYKVVDEMDDYEIIFIDANSRHNQALADIYAKKATKALVFHDVVGEIKLPDNFTIIYIPEDHFAVAYKKVSFI